MNSFLLKAKIGQKQVDHDSCGNKPQYSLHKIPPLPIFRKNLLNSSRLRQRIQIDGDKFFAKLPANGPETSKIIHRVRRSRSIKWVRKFEFDPYLCDRSHINDLRKICYKLRDMTWLNLVIRRVDFAHETGTLGPFISRFARLKSLRVEFPRTQNVGDNDFIRLHKAIEKCSHLRSLEWKANEMPEKSPRLDLTGQNLRQCLKWLKSLKTYETLKKGVLKNNANELEKLEKLPKRRKWRLPCPSIWEVTSSTVGEWGSKQNIDQDAKMGVMKMIALIFQGLEKFKSRTIKTPVNFEDITNVLTVVGFIPTLSQIECEYFNCQISDMEVFAFAHSLSKVAQLKSFSLKVIQKPGISEDCIEKFASVLAKLDNLATFDIYFRRLDLRPQGIKALGNRIESFGNIQCSCSKESIHIYRRNDNE